MGYFECPRCVETTVYRLYEAPWDDNLGACEICGHQFGYTTDMQAVDDGHGGVRAVTTVRPVLSQEVLEAGMRRYQDEVAAKYKARYGHPSDYPMAVRRLQQGLAEEDPKQRANLLNSHSPTLLRAAGIAGPGGRSGPA